MASCACVSQDQMGDYNCVFRPDLYSARLNAHYSLGRSLMLHQLKTGGFFCKQGLCGTWRNQLIHQNIYTHTYTEPSPHIHTNSLTHRQAQKCKTHLCTFTHGHTHPYPPTTDSKRERHTHTHTHTHIHTRTATTKES